MFVVGQETKVCEQCGSRYKITKSKIPLRDKDSLSCDVCGLFWFRWNGSITYDSDLVEQAPWPPKVMVWASGKSSMGGGFVCAKLEGKATTLREALKARVIIGSVGVGTGSGDEDVFTDGINKRRGDYAWRHFRDTCEHDAEADAEACSRAWISATATENGANVEEV